MQNNFWARPYVAWPIGWFIGVLSGLAGNWLWHKIQYRRKNKQDYLGLTYTKDRTTFEGSIQGNINVKEVIDQLLSNSNYSDSKKNSDNVFPLPDDEYYLENEE